MPTGNEGQAADAELDIQSILSGTSDEDTTGQATDTSGQQAVEGQTATEFSFGGRAYKSKAEAEKAHNAIYGKYAEGQGIINSLKVALRDPARLKTLLADPQWAAILSKLGIKQAVEDFEQEDEKALQEGPDYSKLPQEMQHFVQEQEVKAAGWELDREEWSFERKLGRSVTNEEHDAVMRIIARADNLTYEEAWKLAFHDKLLKDAHTKAAAGSSQKAKDGRPPPIPGFVPGVKLDLKKPLDKMSKTEFREHLRGSDEFKQLMSR